MPGRRTDHMRILGGAGGAAEAGRGLSRLCGCRRRLSAGLGLACRHADPFMSLPTSLPTSLIMHRS